MHRPPAAASDLDRNPVVVFWETTWACGLACRHCRALAQTKRHPLELTTQEGFRLLDNLASFDHPPIVVLTGGDPFLRRDLFDLVEYGLGRGLPISVSPSATKQVTRQRLARLKELGLSRLSLSLDGSSPEVHDAFRGVRGSFQETQRCVADALEAGLSLQVNTTVTRYNLVDLPAIASWVEASRTPVWDVFFLVPTGRASPQDLLSPQEHEGVFQWLYTLGQNSPFTVRTTLGQPYRRVWAQRRLAELGEDPEAPSSERVLGLWPTTPSNDAKGMFFISHLGAVCPSGFLPISVGNVRADSVVTLYREAPLFRLLRDPANLKGKCGRCPFNVICGGCRARAYAVTGDPLAEEPCCVFKPDSARLSAGTAIAPRFLGGLDSKIEVRG